METKVANKLQCFFLWKNWNICTVLLCTTFWVFWWSGFGCLTTEHRTVTCIFKQFYSILITYVVEITPILVWSELMFQVWDLYPLSKWRDVLKTSTILLFTPFLKTDRFFQIVNSFILSLYHTVLCCLLSLDKVCVEMCTLAQTLEVLILKFA